MSVISLSAGLNRASTPSIEEEYDVSHDVSHSDQGASALVAARTKLGLSQEAIAKELNLTPDQIRSLERGEHSEFAGLVYLKGYLRNYARIVGVDPKIALMGLNESGPEDEAAIIPRSSRHYSTSTRSSRRAGRVIFPLMLLLLGLVVLGAGYLVFKSQWAADNTTKLLPISNTPSAKSPVQSANGVKLEIVTEKASPKATATQASSGESAQKYGIPIVDEAIEARQSASTESTATKVKSVPSSIQPVNTSSVSATERPLPTPEATQPTPTTTPSPSNQDVATVTPTVNPAAPAINSAGLSLRGLDDSWVEISDGDNIKLFSSTLKKGQILEFQSAPPFVIVLGAAQAVRVEHGGVMLDLPQFTSGNVARFKIRSDGGIESAPAQN